MTSDRRVPAERLHALLAAAGFVLTWPPAGYPQWHALARSIARGVPLPPRPTVYDAEVMRAVHAVDATAAEAAMRAAAGWLYAPHGNGDFQDTLRVWQTGTCGGPGRGGRHFVAARRAAFGRGEDRVDVARCKDCGLAVYAVGREWQLRRSPDGAGVMGWHPIWP
jgi:hypothetical protein